MYDSKDETRRRVNPDEGFLTARFGFHPALQPGAHCVLNCGQIPNPIAPKSGAPGPRPAANRQLTCNKQLSGGMHLGRCTANNNTTFTILATEYLRRGAFSAKVRQSQPSRR